MGFVAALTSAWAISRVPRSTPPLFRLGTNCTTFMGGIGGFGGIVENARRVGLGNRQF